MNMNLLEVVTTPSIYHIELWIQWAMVTGQWKSDVWSWVSSLEDIIGRG